jgi:Putative phage metallopeptidase
MACSTIGKKDKIVPQFTGIESEMQSYVDEYVALAKINGISFSKMPTMGFDELAGRTVGNCWMNPVFDYREISIDKSFWDATSAERKTAVIFHELTHCVCNRDHDYGQDKPYPEDNLPGTVFTVIKNAVVIPKIDDGFYDDGCPVSLMHPDIVPTECMKLHYPEYVKEMFDRCEPW